MARTEEDIVLELQESIRATDKTLDVRQGPIPDIFIRPQSGQLAIASSEAESLRQLFTLQFETSATDSEVKNALANYGSTAGQGTKASHIQHFMRYTKPQIDITIAAGTLVSNISGELIYRVVTGGTIVATAASNFYNASRKTYEVGLLVEAVGIGEKYNLPPNRIINILTPVPGIDSTENRSSSTGGREQETKEAQSARLKDALLGINLGSPGGLQNKIKNDFPEIITDVATIQPFEKEFKRNTTGPSLDIYVLGNNIESYTETYSAVGGETSIVLGKKPVASILSVTVNNVAVSFSLINDASLETGYSLNAYDIVTLNTTLALGDSVVIIYEYNKVLEDVHAKTFDAGSSFLFNTDILIRQPFVVYPVLGGEIQALASYSVTEVEQNIINYFSRVFTFSAFTEVVYPEIIRQNVLTQVSGVQSFRLTEFRRSKGSLASIEPMFFGRNEISSFSADYYNVIVIS